MAAHGRAALAVCLAAALFTTGQAQMPQADAADGIEWCKQYVDESKLTVRCGLHPCPDAVFTSLFLN